MTWMRKTSVPAPISASLSLKRNLSWTFLGYVVYVLCQWGMLVVLAKLVSPEGVGRFALGLAVTAPMVLFANLGLRPFQATDAERRYDFADYLGLRLLTTLLALLAIAGVTVLAGYERETALVILVVGLAKCFEAISDIFYGLLQQREEMERIAKSMMLKGVLSLAVLVLLVYATKSVIWGVAGLATVWALILATYDLRSGVLLLGSFPRPRWMLGRIREMALLSLPLGVSAVLISLNANIPRYVVQHYSGERELGIFAAMAYPLAAGTIVVGALAQSASPRLARYYVDRDHAAFRLLLLKLVGFGATLGSLVLLVVATLGGEILSLIYTPEYADFTSAFVWLAVAASISYAAAFLVPGMTAARSLRAQIPLFIGVAGATFVVSFVLTPSLGILGAAIATAAGAVCQFVGSTIVLAYAIQRKAPTKERSNA